MYFGDILKTANTQISCELAKSAKHSTRFFKFSMKQLIWKFLYIKCINYFSIVRNNLHKQIINIIKKCKIKAKKTTSD